MLLNQIKARENGKAALGLTGKPTPPAPTDMNLLADLLTRVAKRAALTRALPTGRQRASDFKGFARRPTAR